MPNLNEQQTAIVNYIINETGSCNVIARAGTGKTYTLVNGVVVAVIENKLGSIALMAFNKSASIEFETRIQALEKETKNPRFQEVETGTVHSFGFRFWRQHLGYKTRVKVDNSKMFNIVKSQHNDFYPFLPQVLKLVSLAKQTVFTAETPRVEWISLIEHHDIDANGNADEIIDASIKAIAESNRLANEIIDFDDMIYLPVVNDIRVDQFDFVLIDEAQDTNAARRLLAFKMLNHKGRLIAVGDDKQAIYGFTGADSDALNLIKEEMHSVELPLTITYRCPKAVVAEANTIVPDLIAHESAPEGIVRTISEFVEVTE